MGIAPDSAERIRAAVIHFLGMAEEQGHVFYHYRNCKTTDHALDLSDDQVRPKLIDGLHILLEQNTIAAENFASPKRWTVTIRGSLLPSRPI